jgi:hypothetical protein
MEVEVSNNEKSTEWMIGIKNRADLARQWQGEWQTLQDLATKYRYVRIQGDGFAAVSLSSKNPCGRLICKDGQQVPNMHQTVGEAVRCAIDALPFDDPGDYTPGADKKEHRIQAFLIRHALMNNKAMHGLFSGFDEAFDELWFVTDELPAGEHRADIIALGRKGDKYFPVFIELKVKRDLTKLIWQLEGIRDAMALVETDFIHFLAAASGISPEKIIFAEHRLMLVWPTSESGNEHSKVEAFRHDQNGITAVYTKDAENNSYSFIRSPRALACQSL